MISVRKYFIQFLLFCIYSLKKYPTVNSSWKKKENRSLYVIATTQGINLLIYLGFNTVYSKTFFKLNYLKAIELKVALYFSLPDLLTWFVRNEGL